MLRFIVGRLAQMVGVVFVLSLLLFMWLRSLPGGPVDALLGDRGTPEKRAELTAALGLDQPLWVQYLRFLGRAASGDFGTSTAILPGTDSMQIFLTRLPATIELTLLAILLAVAAGIPMGYLAARRRGSAVDNAGIVASLFGVAVPVFFLASLLKYIVAIQLQLLPIGGRQDATLNATRVTGFFVLDGVITQEWDAAWDAFTHLILPALALSTIPFVLPDHPGVRARRARRG
ncbi:MAG TPA: ABC transporter permease, partial [Dermatophilaceae bacterium]|nr:ABC transporter permease [Dermatophilaceae bacterium]